VLSNLSISPYLCLYLSYHLTISLYLYLSPLLQDALLLEGVGKFGRDWLRVAALVSEGGGCVVDNDQCCYRYSMHADPALQKLYNGPWTEAEVITAHITPLLSIPH
jgi:hypothetical protein